MPTPATLRDSTQITLPRAQLDGVLDQIEAKFTVSVYSEGRHCRIVGSPVEIKAVGEFLAQRGIPIP